MLALFKLSRRPVNDVPHLPCEIRGRKRLLQERRLGFQPVPAQNAFIDISRGEKDFRAAIPRAYPIGKVLPSGIGEHHIREKQIHIASVIVLDHIPRLFAVACFQNV